MKKEWECIGRHCLWMLAVSMMLGIGSVAHATVIDAQPENPTVNTTESTEENIIHGWNKTKDKYYKSGVAVTGVQKIHGNLYYFEEDGKLYKKTGYRTIAGKKYYFNKNHTMKTGVVKVKGKRYYFNKKDGVRYEQKGIRKVDGKYYRFGSKYELKSGWARSKNKRYYFDKKTYQGAVGWTYIGEYKYYFNKKGQLLQDLRNSKVLSKKQTKKNQSDTYMIKVNRTASCVTVYARDYDKQYKSNKASYVIPVVSFVCSAGNATPVGTFSIKDKLRWHELMGPSWGQWCEHLTDSILFHSVFYNAKNNNKSLDVSAYNKLGTMASHGCIRLTAGDAKWIFDNCGVGTVVTIYNNKKNKGPFDKPKAKKLSSGHTWDPTDPAFK